MHSSCGPSGGGAASPGVLRETSVERVSVVIESGALARVLDQLLGLLSDDFDRRYTRRLEVDGTDKLERFFRSGQKCEKGN